MKINRDAGNDRFIKFCEKGEKGKREKGKQIPVDTKVEMEKCGEGWTAIGIALGKDKQ